VRVLCFLSPGIHARAVAPFATSPRRAILRISTLTTYDGDGNRVMKEEAGVATYYVGGVYELSEEVRTSYYYVAGQRVAMRVGAPGTAGTLTYLHGDHLGSTSLATDANGGELYRRGYYPFGEERYAVGDAITDHGFTGQREEAYIDLIEMGARWYDSYLNRFVSPDTIVPDASDPQSLNAYAYAYNNPVRYVDPSGHVPVLTFDDGGHGWTTVDWDAYNEEQARSQGPGRPVPESWQDIAYALNVVGALLDTWQWAISVGPAIAESAGVLTGQPEVVASANQTYNIMAGGQENVLSFLSLGTAAAADWFGGYSYLDTNIHPDTGEQFDELVVGQETCRELSAFAIGLIPSPTVDALVNSRQMYWGWRGLDKEPTSELRIPLYSWTEPPEEGYGGHGTIIWFALPYGVDYED